MHMDCATVKYDKSVYCIYICIYLLCYFTCVVDRQHRIREECESIGMSLSLLISEFVGLEIL